MVGPLLLMKILHCKKKCQTQSRKNTETDSQETTSTSSKKRIIKNELDTSATICRVCLKAGNIPIFHQKNSEDISEALVTFGGIEVKKDDKYPKHLCSSCHALLRGAILFRKTAQESEQILKKPVDIQQDDSGDDFNDVELDDDTLEFQIPVKKGTNYRCKRCDMEFKTLKEYNEHRMSEEHETRRRICPICQKSLSAVYFKKHLLLHNFETPSHMCDICGKSFIIPGQFTRHRLTHFYELPFECGLCPYRGRFTESLRLHMRQHTGEKPYQCEHCSARFVTKSNLTKHTRTHTGARDHKCEMCGKGFYTKKTLEMHLKVDHTGIKDHICNICGKAFGYRKQMMKHQLKVHKRQKLRSGKLPLYLQVKEMAENNTET